ncbi:LOW QUALITY PROTEIN: pseudouridylate synthase 7 homolog-like protein [Salmo salar]|uniref:LOW QUALITY PROTEIN: pseudouridylate synthase 7 homolog-like protein n=1 Tax=Salmo salar TaxID=8030 RepID=A0A1S3N147_SALSA|nr:LOW QUALITY PROTEIN: pseudouridylate synthase 7 homolog-like protein [Salmo salar]
MTMKEEAPSVPECYISEHEGFYGTIKNSTRDFVVTEIDIHGQMVTKPSVSDVPQSSNITEACPGAKSEGKTNIISPKHQHNLKEENCPPVVKDVDSEPGPGQNGDITSTASQDCFDLRMILGQVACEELEQFTALLREVSSSPNDGVEKNLANQESSNGSEKKMANQELSLGSFPDKHQRANVHRAVRHNFPFLLTVTNQSEIRVKEDPAFKLLSGLVSEEEAEDFIRFIDTKMPNSVYTFRGDDSKEHRTAVHHFLSRRFGKLVETKSFSDQQQKTTAITVRLREKGKPRKRTADESKDEEVYTAFTLRKESQETLEAISYMAAVLGVLPSDFTYAGIKDKRAVTYQSMVVKKISPQRLREKTSEFEKRGVVLSSVRSVSEPLHLGRLQGNHFDLVVRDLRPHQGHGTLMELDSLVQEAVENVQVKGFVNYYGPQRFGTGQSVQSDCVGLALLKEEMVAAVRLFFTPEEGDDSQNVAKRHFLQTDNAKEALSLMPMSKARERMMLRALHRYGTGPEGCTRAWLSLPHGMRVFYPHAYCSRVWNEAAAHRLTTLGHRARQGDLVWKQRGEEGIEAGETSLPQIHVVTAAEEEEEVYSLGQVVLPMLGNSVKYPENPVGGWYQERLARDGLQSCRFRVTPLKLNLPGCYRPLLAIPHNLTYRLEQGQRAGERQQECNGKSQASGAVPQHPGTDTPRPGGLERQRGGESAVLYPDTDTTRPGGLERQRGGESAVLYPDTDTTRPGGLERQRGGESAVLYPDTDTTRPGGLERQRGGESAVLYPDTDTTRPGGLERQRGGESAVLYPDTDTTRPGGLERQRGGESTVLYPDTDTPSLTLNFDLDSSCYATVCLREVMKCDP